MRSKVTDISELRAYFHDGMTIMVPGFSCVGIPETIISAIIEWEIRNLIIITSSTGFEGRSAGSLVEHGLVKKYVAPFISARIQYIIIQKTDLKEQILPESESEVTY